VKLAVLGGGGARIPEFVQGVLARPDPLFTRIALWEPDPVRQQTIGRLATELAAALGHPGLVEVTRDPEAALSGAAFVFSAIRVGGDAGRVIDEEVALRHGLVGQETTGPGGCAMALRTIPVVLEYCQALQRCAPGAVLINFTNPAGLITQAIARHTSIRAVGVCDTPATTLGRLAEFLGADPGRAGAGYAGLNHLGWVTSFRVAGEERIGTLIARFEELQRFDHRFAPFDPALVRRLGAIPTEYLYYYYEPRRYLASVRQAGASRGAAVLRLNEELLTGIGKAFESGGLADAWAVYSALMGVRHDTYLRADITGASGQREARAHRPKASQVLPSAGPGGQAARARSPSGYAGVALAVIEGLAGRRPGTVIVNTVNGTSLPFLDPGDVAEVPALVDGSGVAPLAAGVLPRAARALVSQVKEYECEVVEAAVTGDAGRAALALALHPLVPGPTTARELLAEYRQRHRRHLAYLR
jgi:6-phospho-beta-glucosidase